MTLTTNSVTSIFLKVFCKEMCGHHVQAQQTLVQKAECCYFSNSYIVWMKKKQCCNHRTYHGNPSRKDYAQKSGEQNCRQSDEAYNISMNGILVIWISQECHTQVCNLSRSTSLELFWDDGKWADEFLLHSSIIFNVMSKAEQQCLQHLLPQIPAGITGLLIQFNSALLSAENQELQNDTKCQ